MAVSIKEALGGKFHEAYTESLKKKRVKRLDVSGQVKNDIIELVKETMDPEKGILKYKNPENKDVQYDVFLVETFSEIRVFEQKYGPSVGFKWSGKSLSCFITTDDVQMLEPEAAYVVVGVYKINPGKGKHEGRTFHNFNVHGIISMQEIAEYSKEQKTQEDEITEKVEAHTGAPVEKEVEVKESE